MRSECGFPFWSLKRFLLIAVALCNQKYHQAQCPSHTNICCNVSSAISMGWWWDHIFFFLDGYAWCASHIRWKLGTGIAWSWCIAERRFPRRHIRFPNAPSQQCTSIMVMSDVIICEPIVNICAMMFSFLPVPLFECLVRTRAYLEPFLHVPDSLFACSMEWHQTDHVVSQHHGEHVWYLTIPCAVDWLLLCLCSSWWGCCAIRWFPRGHFRLPKAPDGQGTNSMSVFA